MIRIGAYFDEDFDAIDIANAEMIGDMSRLREMIVPEHSRTGFHGDRPVIIAGVVPIWDGVGQGWMAIDKDLPSAIGTIKAMRKGMRDIARMGPFHRIQADVRASFAKGQRFLAMLEFSNEGPLDAYSAEGEDYERFALVNRQLIVSE